LEKSKPKIL
jgi:hypothetical protein